MDIVQLSMFDGKVCGRCQKYKLSSEFGKNRSTKDGLQSYCTECRKAYDGIKNKEYYHRDIEKSREEGRQNYYRYRDKIANTNRVRAKVWYRNNLDRARASRTLEYQNNPDAVRLRSKTWYNDNKERAKARGKRYKKVHSHYINSINQARRARQKAIGGTYTAEHWQQLCDWFGNICLACGTSEDLSVDHVIPLDPGPNTIGNLQPLCRPCNSSKRRKTTDYRDPDRLAAFLEHIK